MGAVIMVNVAAVYSTLGNPNSLIPLLVKDTAASAGMTTGSLITGKEEGQDRLIDEVGTEVIWLCAIPAFKWLFDKTVFKAFNLDSKFDVRNLKNKDIFEKIKEYAPTNDIKNNLKKIEKKQALFKNLAFYKFFFSTGMAIASYIGLTKAKQAYTENKIKQNLIAEYNAKKQKEEKQKLNTQELSFKGVGDIVKNFAFSPVRNMWILDGAITTERLADSRSPQEFIGYGIKEASTLCFMYYAGGKIQEYMEKRAIKKHNKNIGLDARVLENGNLQKTFVDGSIKKDIEAFKAAVESKKDLELYDFLHKNPENGIVKAAKESKIIQTFGKTGKIDTRTYIDLDEIRTLFNNVDTLYKQYTEALQTQKGKSSAEISKLSEGFFKSVKRLKRNSIITNIGTCILALGVITPAIMLAKRFFSKDNTEFQTKKEIRQQLINEGIIS